MLLVQRPAITKRGQILGRTAAALVMLLAGALSLLSWQPAPADEAPPAAGTPADAAPEAAVQFEFVDAHLAGVAFQCIVIEADDSTLRGLLAQLGPVQPNPETMVATVSDATWEETLKKLEVAAGAKVLARPQMITLDKTVGEIQIAKRNDGDGNMESLSIRITPAIADSGTIKLDFQLRQTPIAAAPGLEVPPPLRQLNASQSVPAGHALLIAHRPMKPGLRPVVVAVQPKILPLAGTATAAPLTNPPPAVEPATPVPGLGNSPLAQLGPHAPGATPVLPAAPRVPPPPSKFRRPNNPNALAPSMNPYQFNVVNGAVTALFPIVEPAAETAERLKEQIAKAKLEDVRIGVDSQINGLVIHAKVNDLPTIQALLQQLGVTPTTPNSAKASSTERKLLELDLAEAKLGVEEAQANLDFARQQRATSPGTITEQEVRQRALQIERAKIQLQRIEVQLEALPESPGNRPAQATTH